MKIGIHHRENSFSKSWIEKCKKNNINYKLINAYDNDVISQIKDCDIFLWHFHQSHSKDTLFAKELLYAIQSMGIKVFPDFNTSWFFDDKISQKYLLEAINAPLVPTYIFYDKNDALEWKNNTTFPKIFKLRKGAGSANVKFVKDKKTARSLINKAFSSGFSPYDKLESINERWYKYKKGKTDLLSVIKGVLRIAKTTEFAKISGNESGYIYFQDFIPNNKFDIRVVVIGDKAFAIKRMVRENDFRASGSGEVLYEKKHFDESTIKLSFDISKKLDCQSLAIDYVYKEGEPNILEISYGFTEEVYYPCKGYWDKNLNWIPGLINPMGWIIEDLIKN